MSLSKRLIARLDVKGNRLIKGVRFEGLRVMGDPLNAAKNYVNAGADELLYLDAVASLYGRNNLSAVLRRTASEVSVPITAGGGIRTISDASLLFSSGADKVAINTAALEDPALISTLINAFGQQAVVISIQARKTSSGQWICMKEAGRELTSVSVIDWINKVQSIGVGEILLTSVDADGTCQGPDKDLILEVKNVIKLPLVLSGGFTSVSDFDTAYSCSYVSGIAAGAALHKQLLSIPHLKRSLQKGESEYAFRILPEDSTRIPLLSTQLNSLRLGIVNYNMGNIASLENALKRLGFTELVTSQDVNLLNSCDLLFLPGVGSFPHGMQELHKLKLDLFIKEWCQLGKPMIGICLGMQLFFMQSSELVDTDGLGLIDGDVSKINLSKDMGDSLLPHMGWNLCKSTTNKIYPENQYQYFVHSYCAELCDPSIVTEIVEFANSNIIASIKKENLIGFQYHPEKSGIYGLLRIYESVRLLAEKYIFIKN